MEAHGFTQPEQRFYDWDRPYSTQEYLALLRTHSDHRLLPPKRLSALLEAIARVIDERDGSITHPYRVVLLLTQPPP